MLKGETMVLPDLRNLSFKEKDATSRQQTVDSNVLSAYANRLQSQQLIAQDDDALFKDVNDADLSRQSPELEH